MNLKGRVTNLERRTPGAAWSLCVVYEAGPGRYRDDEGHTYTEAQLDELGAQGVQVVCIRVVPAKREEE